MHFSSWSSLKIKTINKGFDDLNEAFGAQLRYMKDSFAQFTLTKTPVMFGLKWIKNYT